MAVEVDVRAVATFSSLAESTISSILENPTVELVRTLLCGISGKAREYDQLRAQKFRLEVELETAVRTSESKVKALKGSVEKGLAETSRLRTELQNSENVRSKTELEVEQMRSAQSQETTEASTLKSRLSSLEAAHRDTLAVLDSKSSICDKMQARQLLVARFREQSLQQELDLLKRNNDWLEEELKTKNADHLKFRRDKSARITELQRLNEQYISEAESLKHSEATLRSRLDDQLQKFEDSLTTIQELREEAVQASDAFRVELDSTARLADLQKTSADTAKQRANELSMAMEEIREDAADEIGRIRAEVETEHKDKVAAEQRVTQLESTIGQLQSELEMVQSHPNKTESLNGRGTLTPTRPGTPTGVFSPGSVSRPKNNLSMTQLFTEYKKVERELAGEKRHSEQLSRSVEEMVENLEKTQPEIDELRADHSRLQEEMVEISALRDVAAKDRDIAARQSRKLQGQIEELRKERDVFQQQVRDASSQIKILLMEQHQRDTGQQLSQQEMEGLRKAAVGDESGLAAMSDTGRIISENLTVFRNIVELQEQNTRIHSMLRQLGDRMESSEAQEKESLRQQERKELEALRARVSTYKDELQNMVTQSRSYIKERDMFRNMLVRRGQLPGSADASAFAQSMPLPTANTPPRGKAGSLQGSPAADDGDYATLLKELQHHFDSYKAEAATDNSALKNQLAELSKRNSQLQVDLSKSLSQLSAANQRGEMLQSNYNMLKSESQELQRRSETIRETATKQELRTQQAAEELVEAKSQMDGMQRELANLKAEKGLWKSIEQRLIEDNESLRNERARLDNLNSTFQNILNEREQADSETHRRLQRQTESLESELQTTKRRLNDESEEGKKVALRREYEHEQSQKRVDDLMSSMTTIREESVQIKMARDQLQVRIDEMTVELRSAEERLEVLQTRPATGDRTGNAGTGEEGSLNREQELSIEISECRRDLDLKIAELERLNEEVETYKGISQSSEERLQELSDTNDQYREETERALEEKNQTIKDLERRVEEISDELSTTNNELTRLRDERGTSERKFDEQKSSLEEEITRLRDQNEELGARAELLLGDVKRQADIANEHQENYENELVKHADAARTLQITRTEYNQLRLDSVELKAAAESAKTSLEQKEESWSEQRAKFDRELVELRNRREEVMHQNSILHGQLEEVTKQISLLQRDRTGIQEDQSDLQSGPALENLQEVIKYLRREKEIVDVQYHLSTQDGKRLKQRLDHTQAQLDETRLKLDQQLRAEADTERNALSHNKLMETINELNLYRESSVTLRAEAKSAASSLAEKSQRVETLLADIEPLRTRIAELENLSELREGEMKLLQEDRDHWQNRTQNILAKYDRIDPAELETLKEKLSTLEAERDEAIAARDSLQAQADSIPQQVEAAKQDLRARLSEQFKARNKELTGRINQKQIDLDAAVAQGSELQKELDTAKEQLKSLADQSAAPPINGLPHGPATNPLQTSHPDQGSAPQVQDLNSRVVELEAQLASKVQEGERLRAEREAAFRARETELKGALTKRLATVRSEIQAETSKTINELEQRLEASQKELEALRTGKAASQELSGPNGPAPSEQQSDELSTIKANQELPSLTEDQIKLLVRENEFVKNLLRANIRKAVEKGKSDLRKEIESAQATSGQAVSTATMEELEQKFAAEKDTLIKELDAKFDSEKQAILKAQEQQRASEQQALISKHQDQIASEKQTAIIELQEKFAEERLTFSKESQKKIEDQVALAEKRNAVKVNLAQSQARTAMAKVQIVSKAAEETPQKPVVEVWAVAKDAKPPPAGSAVSKQATPAPHPPKAVPAASQQPETKSSVSAETAQQSTGAPTPNDQAEPISNATTATMPTADNPLEPVSAIPKPPQSNHTGTGPAALRNLHSSLPRGNRGSRGGRQGHQSHQDGSNPEPRNLPQQQQQQQQQQHQPFQAIGRGSGIPRSGFRGSGPGRGGGHQVQTQNSTTQSTGQEHASGSPRGGLNAQARQFNPQGNKRSREDGPSDGQGGKRIRGGGTGT